MANIEELLESEEFLDKLANTKSDEEFIKAFKDSGVELSEEQIKAIKANLNEVMKSIPQEELEGVSGGIGGEIHVGIDIDDEKLRKMGVGAGLGATAGFLFGMARAAKKNLNYNPRIHGKRRADALLFGAKTAIKEGLKGVVVGSALGAAAGVVADATQAGVHVETW